MKSSHQRLKEKNEVYDWFNLKLDLYIINEQIRVGKHIAGKPKLKGIFRT